MIDLRQKDTNWNIPTDANGTASNEFARLAVLMDIRDELKKLNALLNCKNFTRIPIALGYIEENTRPPRPPKKKPIKKKR